MTYKLLKSYDEKKFYLQSTFLRISKQTILTLQV